ncbi:NADPH:quinone oxidoreductase family protein [Falsigemmobacter faecalis]|uniref:NADPH:quinone oxidoreductase family protein n=1 Tax=Falsigemmobacter faecalis TaxID=2488730 RepID=A0A3P3DV90_9RHOB|nr:NADPH:quinone oxidoreductase family protein [Falsigemmobacter faecalis]RRH78193.1 NADPH:quinone oxidoreductase family protein [Falsigemmobacter faecalis]
MKILLSQTPGGPDSLTLVEAQKPEPGPGEVRIRVRMVGINYPDTLVIEDRYQIRPPRPFAPGGEFVGEIDALGPDVQGMTPGTRVMALPLWGAMAEWVCVAADKCHAVPAGVSDEAAAALQMTYGTSLYALEERGGIKAGETVVVLGAAGGIGLASVELAKHLGARVIACVSSEEKAATAREHGADEVLIYPAGPLDREAAKAFSTGLKALTGAQGADIVVDAVGGSYSEPALRCMAWGGRFLIVGFPAGIAQIPANLPLLKSCDIRGIFWGAAVERDPAANRTAMQRLLQLCQAGHIRPRIDRVYPLDEGGAAIASLSARGVRGKVLVAL